MSLWSQTLTSRPCRLTFLLTPISLKVWTAFVVTFTAHLPFPVGIPNDLGHSIGFPQQFVDPEYVAAYGRPFVNIRLFDLPQSGLPSWGSGTHDALKRFYCYEFDADADQRYGEEALVEHNQWVSLETPWGAVDGYDADPFHRCLNTLNYFLEAVFLITRDIHLRVVSGYDLRPVVVIGICPKGGEWRMESPMFMHPEGTTPGLLTVHKPFDEKQLNGALAALVTKKPYLTTATWRAREQRAYRQNGDGADSVISFQVAAESLLFETYRMLLVDEGLTGAQITAELEAERPYKRLFTEILPSRLGGNWHVDQPGTPIGKYWKDLYLVRNSVIHAGMRAHPGNAEAAQLAYRGLRDYLEQRLWIRHKTYPRTVYARLGKEQLETKGWMTNWMKGFIA